jgi:SNF2 family DNA or RNA helicase
MLLNQHHIRVDASGCKIAHIDVGKVKFQLPDFLKNYQRDGVYRMQEILDAGYHCLLADEMGFKKTMQVLSLICANRKKQIFIGNLPCERNFSLTTGNRKTFPQ